MRGGHFPTKIALASVPGDVKEELNVFFLVLILLREERIIIIFFYQDLIMGSFLKLLLLNCSISREEFDD